MAYAIPRALARLHRNANVRADVTRDSCGSLSPIRGNDGIVSDKHFPGWTSQPSLNREQRRQRFVLPPIAVERKVQDQSPAGLLDG